MSSLSVFIQLEQRVLVKADQLLSSWDGNLSLITVLCGSSGPRPSDGIKKSLLFIEVKF